MKMFCSAYADNALTGDWLGRNWTSMTHILINNFSYLTLDFSRSTRLERLIRKKKSSKLANRKGNVFHKDKARPQTIF